VNPSAPRQWSAVLSLVVGDFRTFGPDGPAYQVLEILDAPEGRVRIQVLESGETLDYPALQALQDPEPR
jgi:hypothetical protein